MVSHDHDARTLELKRGRTFTEVPLPQALLPGRLYDTDAQEDALQRIGRSLLVRDGRYPAIESVLRRDPFDREIQTNEIEEMTALLLALDGRHLVIQGPPGSGKTWTSGRLIARLIGAGKRVGVASTSHRAIHKLLGEVEEAAAELAGPGSEPRPARLGRGVGAPSRVEIDPDALTERLAPLVADRLANRVVLPRYLTVTHAAIYLSLTEDAVRGCVKRGALPVVRLEGRVLIDRVVLDRRLAQTRDRSYDGGAPDNISGPARLQPPGPWHQEVSPDAA